MNLSDNVRQYCKKHYVDPARKKGERNVVIKSGDVHKALNYKNRYPLVCTALGANLFEKLCKVTRISVYGPLNGANTVFTFELI